MTGGYWSGIAGEREKVRVGERSGEGKGKVMIVHWLWQWGCERINFLVDYVRVRPIPCECECRPPEVAPACRPSQLSVHNAAVALAESRQYSCCDTDLLRSEYTIVAEIRCIDNRACISYVQSLQRLWNLSQS